MLRIVPAMALALVMSPATAAKPTAAMPGWMTGCWSETKGERVTEECWMPPRGGIMLGAGRSGIGDRVTDAENMRIDSNLALADGSVAPIAYRAAQKGGGWTTFALSPSAEPGVTFVNAAHDYPQRIRYWREGASLMAEISLIDGSKAKRWTYIQAHP